MINSVTHFEIFAEEPAKLVEFYRNLLGWQIEKVRALTTGAFKLRPRVL